MKKFVSFLFFFSILSIGNVDAQIQEMKDCPVHEAFFTQEYGNLILQAVPLKPPVEISETPPAQSNSELQWIPGYWGWSQKLGDYIWVTGVWRKPPPRHQWISGYWKRFPEGWVWIKGFWSAINENELTFIDVPPPDSIDEKVPLPPNPTDSYFWMPGFWKYDAVSRQYIWFSGRWELFKNDFIYIPARYYWRENGYVFMPPFWDWTVEKMGMAYACVSIPPEDRENVFHPLTVLEPTYLVEILYPYWPDYICFFRFHFYFHKDLWVSWGGFPSWWNWSTWWCFTWQDTWWVWWWWCHPGYPAPVWITPQLAEAIAPPLDFVLKLMRDVKPPANVSSNGVIGNYKMIQSLQQATGKQSPILPSDPSQVIQIQALAEPVAPQSPPYIRPTGPIKATISHPKKPFFGPEKTDLTMPPQRALAPSEPFEREKPSIQQLQKPPFREIAPQPPSYSSQNYLQSNSKLDLKRMPQEGRFQGQSYVPQSNPSSLQFTPPQNYPKKPGGYPYQSQSSPSKSLNTPIRPPAVPELTPVPRAIPKSPPDFRKNIPDPTSSSDPLGDDQISYKKTDFSEEVVEKKK